MDNETRIKLLDAGYTKEEIEAGETANAAGKDSENKAQETNEVKKDPEENKEDQNKEEQNKEDKNVSEDPTLTLLKSLTKTVEGLQKTVKVLQDSNIKGATGGAPEKDAAEVIMMDFMKNF